MAGMYQVPWFSCVDGLISASLTLTHTDTHTSKAFCVCCEASNCRTPE